MKTPFTGDPAADALLTDNPFALLLGMLLDQQVTMEFAFRAPAMLAARLDGPLEPATLDGLGADKVEALFRDKPALHRYPGSMGKRAYALSAFPSAAARAVSFRLTMSIGASAEAWP